MSWEPPVAAAVRPPNVILIVADDLGYGDLGCYGRTDLRTPHLDRMAAEGLRFTGFQVPQAVCSASRAALLTGCYPNRVGILGALFPGAPMGLHPGEVTMAEVLQARGHATCIVGKWHLGDAPPFHPLRHGFDEWLGLPYSNDMWPRHPTMTNFPPLPMLDGFAVVNGDVGPEDQAALTARYTARAVDFIRRQARRPFFLYVAHSMPHVPIFASERFRGRSGAGLYGDVIEELDASVGDILAALQETGVERDTLVLFTSDNGPWLTYGDHAGITGGLREGKGTAWEGGVRVPLIARWPGQVAPGRVHSGVASTLDLLPTLAALTGAPMPQDRVVDGRNLASVFTNAHAGEVEDPFIPGYYGANLCHLRWGHWKRVFSHAYQRLDRAGAGGLPGAYIQQRTGPALFHLGDDPAEAADVSEAHSEVAALLDQAGDRWRRSLGDGLRTLVGTDVRPAGFAAAFRVLPEGDGRLSLRATNAVVQGVDLRYGLVSGLDAITSWTRTSDRAEWELVIHRTGAYRIEVEHASRPGLRDVPLDILVNGQRIRRALAGQGADTFVMESPGTVHFAAGGRHRLEVRGAAPSGSALDALRAVVLHPVP